MSYLPSHDHMLEATLAHTGLDDLKLCGQRQHTHATVAVAAPSSGSRRSPPRSQISSFPQHAIPQITRLSPSILAPPHRLSPASFNISFMLYFDFVPYVDIATAAQRLLTYLYALFRFCYICRYCNSQCTGGCTSTPRLSLPVSGVAVRCYINRGGFLFRNAALILHSGSVPTPHWCLVGMAL